jgi:hypothetical protein
MKEVAGMKATRHNGETKKTAAKKYVDSQLKIMKKYGTPVRLSARDYKSLVNKVARASAL